MNPEDNPIAYQSRSKFYDLFDLIFFLGGKGNPRAGLLDVIDNTRQDILDICVGTAASSLLVAAQHEQTHIWGIDLSADMLAVAQRKIAQRKLTNLELAQMSAEALKFANNRFDGVMISFALHEFETRLREQVFREAVRVLKPGGWFCAIDFARQENVGNRIFLKLWSLAEPSCFTGFLAIDWYKQLAPYGLRFESEREFSFSKLYVFHKG